MNKTLKSFVNYSEKHPQERFWQALCNWAKVNYILFAKNSSWSTCEDQKYNLSDTYYIEDK
jgi:hypothetical protein